MKYVHRACLAEWREKTTNPVNRQYCSECKGAFRLVVKDAAFEFVIHSLLVMLKIAIPLVALEAILLTLGYTFKLVAGVLQGDLDDIDWTADLYHHFAGAQLFVVYLIHFRVLAPILQDSVGAGAVVILTLPSLLLEVFVGYFAHFVVWCFNSILWDWQVYYVSGCVVVAMYAFYFHDSIKQAYRRWAIHHQSEVVLDREQRI